MATRVDLEPAAIRFFHSNSKVFEIYMLQFELYFEKRADAKIGIGLPNPTQEFQLRDYIFLKNLKNTDNNFKFITLDTNESLYMIPIGSVVIWPSMTIPENWKECNGDLVDIENYQDLFNLLGYHFTSSYQQSLNIGKPLTEQLFNIPDFRGGLTPVNRLNDSVQVGQRYPNIDYNNSLTTYITEKNNLINNFRLKDTQLPAHKHVFTHTDTNKTFLKQHSHQYVLGSGSGSRLPSSSTIAGVGLVTNSTQNTIIPHSHTFTNASMTVIPTNDSFSIEQQYIIMKFIIRVK